MTSATLPGWEPETPITYARPVQDEDATAGLCGCELPGGGGCLVWPNGNDIRWAIVSSPDDFVVDDVVPSGDMHTLVALGGGVQQLHSSVFVVDGVLYCLVVARISNVGSIKLYEADDPDAPTSWSLKTTLQSVAAAGSKFGNNSGVGVPLILDSGRWVLPCPIWDPGDGASFYAQNAGIWISDNDGTSFTKQLEYSHPYPGFPRTEDQAKVIAQDPATGDLWFTSSTSVSFVAVQTALWRSTDDGTSWTLVDGDGGNYATAPRFNPFVDNENNIYAASMSLAAGGSISWGIYVYDGSGATFADWTYTGESWPAPGSSPDERTFKAIVAGNGVYFFTLDQVMRVLAQPLWHWGGLLFGRTGAWI